MAGAGITKSISLPSGVSVGFWKVKSLHFNFDDIILLVNVDGYVDQSAFDGGKTPAESRQLQFLVSQLNPTNVGTVVTSIETLVSNALA